MGHVYIPTNWINKKTQLNAANMNKIEEELARLARESGGITEILEGPGIQVTNSTESSVIVGLRNGTSEDNLLVLDKDNGLILTLSLGYDPETRELVLSSGSGWKTSVKFDEDKYVTDGNYDPDTRNLVLTISDGSDVVIDLSNLKINWEFIESETIKITEDWNDEGIQTFKLECKVSQLETNSITVKDDGLYSERLDWGGIGVSDETDGSWEFDGETGSKDWFFEGSKSVKIDKYILEGKSGSLSYYNFGYKLSSESGNRIKLDNKKLYVPDMIPEEKLLFQELERLNEEYEALKLIKIKSTNSIESNDVTTEFDDRYVELTLKVSEYLGNELIMTDTGIYMPPYTPGPGKPDLTPYIRRLEELELEYPRQSIEVNYVKESTNI